MRFIFCSFFVLIFTTGLLKSQEQVCINNKLGYSITFPKKLNKKGILEDENSIEINGIRYVNNVAIESMETRVDLICNTSGFAVDHLAKGFVNGKTAYNIYLYDSFRDKYCHIWLIDCNSRVLILSVEQKKIGYADLKYVYPFFYSFQFNNGEKLPIANLIKKENQIYNGPTLGFYNDVDFNSLEKNSKKPINEILYAESSKQVTETKTQRIDSDFDKQSDIDLNIPKSTINNINTFALIIGNENYENEIPVKYAQNDAKTFANYILNTFDVPSNQVHLILNATYGKMLKEIQWLNSVAKAFNGKAKIIFYYAGHGMPDEKNKEAYLLPTDSDASQVITSISLEKIYKILEEYPTEQTTVFLDACFSGASREGMLFSGRGVRIKPKESEVNGSLIVFSAVSGDQTAHPYEKNYHGLFSYYLMKKIQETKGVVNYGALYDYIKEEIEKQSVILGREQSPQVKVNYKNQELWKSWTF